MKNLLLENNFNGIDSYGKDHKMVLPFGKTAPSLSSVQLLWFDGLHMSGWKPELY